jgi:hypothetical protein
MKTNAKRPHLVSRKSSNYVMSSIDSSESKESTRNVKSEKNKNTNKTF